jgi:hypothetical protein
LLILVHYWQLVRDRLGWSFGPERPLDEHVRAAVAWLLRAQRATPDDGVAHSYDLRRRIWHASYPETTGYIIPTLIDYAELYGAPECKEAAIRMANWEIEVQLPDGGVRAGTMAAEVVVPTVFNTGQVLFGFARAYVATREARFATALRRASDWLLAAQDADGAWRRFPSPFAPGKVGVKAYNTRTAFGLVRAWQALGEQRWLDAADANGAWTLSTTLPNAFLPNNCLTDAPAALTHTLAYSMRGLMEIGVATGNSRYVDHAVRMAAAIVPHQREDGAFPARFDAEWRPAERSSCLTGNSQLALNFFRLGRITGDRHFEPSAVKANRFNMRAQDLNQRDPNRAGGLKGSHPISGDYITWRYPNWAVKFFIDALMYEQRPDVDNLG